MAKRILSLIIILLLVAGTTFAEEISFEESQGPVLKTGGVHKGEAVEIPSDGEETNIGFFADIPFDEYIALYVEAYIDEYDALPVEIPGLSQYQIHKSDIGYTFYDAAMRHPETLLTTGGFSYRSDSYTGIVSSVIPNYIVDNSGIAAARTAIENGIQSYVDLANQFDTDVEKLLAIHDKMVELCEYDWRVMDSDPAVVAQAPKTVYHALGVFRDKLAVCQGYSQAIYVIGKAIGIEMDFCNSEEVNHMWNYVKLDGKWYHLDMTNDDPQDSQGRANHTYFLFSDAKINVNAHGTDYRRFGGGTSPVCNDTTYETNHFFNMPFAFKGVKNSDGCYHASANFKSTSAGLDATVTFKSPSLYTGPIIVAPFITSGKYDVMENGAIVTKTGTNLYTIEFSVGSAPETFLIYKKGNSFVKNSDRGATTQDKSFLRIIQPDAEGTDLTQFTSFVLGVDTLTPYSTKYNWK